MVARKGSISTAEAGTRTPAVARGEPSSLTAVDRTATSLHVASLRRVEVRIEPQTITDFLKWKNRLAEYNGGRLPEGVTSPEEEPNSYLA